MYPDYCILPELNFTRNCVLIIRFQSLGDEETTSYRSIGTISSTLCKFKNVFCVLCRNQIAKSGATILNSQRRGTYLQLYKLTTIMKHTLSWVPGRKNRYVPIQFAFNSHSVHVQFTFSSYSVHVQFMFSSHSKAHERRLNLLEDQSSKTKI